MFNDAPVGAIPTVEPHDPNDGLETWVNAAEGRSWIRKFAGAYGQTTVVHLLGGQRFSLTPAERRFNEEAASSPEHNFFRNGRFQPVSLIETEKDAGSLLGNPNVMSDGDIVQVLHGSMPELVAKLATVTNPITLQRIERVAEEQDVSMSKARAIKDRLGEIDPIAAGRRVRIGDEIEVTDPGPQAADPLRDTPQEPDIYDDQFFADAEVSQR